MSKYTTEGSRSSKMRRAYQSGGSVNFDDQASPADRASRKKQTLDERNATSIFTIERPNLDKNALHPDDMTDDYHGLRQERT